VFGSSYRAKTQAPEKITSSYNYDNGMGMDCTRITSSNHQSSIYKYGDRSQMASLETPRQRNSGRLDSSTYTCPLLRERRARTVMPSAANPYRNTNFYQPSNSSVRSQNSFLSRRSSPASYGRFSSIRSRFM